MSKPPHQPPGSAPKVASLATAGSSGAAAPGTTLAGRPTALAVPERQPAPRPQGRITPTAIPFQPDALAIELSRPPIMARVTLYTILLLIVTGGGWAAYSQVDRVVVATGKLITSQPLIVLQPLETAIVRRLDVRVGDRVSKGQVVAVLDPTVAEADLSSSLAELASVEAQIARIEAEIADEPMRPPPGIPVEVMAIETRILEDRRTEYRARLEVFDARKRKAQTEMASAREQQSFLERRQRNLTAIVEMREKLHEKEIGSRLSLLVAQNERLVIEQDLGNVRARQGAVAEEMAGIAAEHASFAKERRRQLGEQLVEAGRQRERLIGARTKSQQRRSIVTLQAPVDAIVLERARLSVGSVAQSASPLVTLVPAEATLEAEIEVPSKDIALVRSGDDVRLKLEAFPFQRYGTLLGKIKSVAPDATQKPPQEGGTTVFKGLVKLSSERLDEATDVRLSPGMVATAEISIGKRSVLSYFVYPIIRALDESIREP